MTVRPEIMLLLLAGCATTRSGYVEQIQGTAIEFEMVWIEDGVFWIGRTEVTWDQYLIFCNWAGKHDVPPGADAVSRPSKPLDVFPHHRDWGEGARPAVGMSWNGAKQFCSWLSQNTGRAYRLPTEDEWLIACGADVEPVTEYAWCAENSGGMTREVATRQPNAHGVHDMFGNLWEYCGNPYDPSDPERAVLRGGSWRDPAAGINRSTRLRFDNDWTLQDPNVPPGLWWIPDGEQIGFRVLRSGDP